MRESRTAHFKRALRKFPIEIRKAFYKQLRFLLTDIRHPSLRAKKYDESGDVWQMRVTDNVRCYFVIDSDCYVFLDIEKHRD